MAFPALRRKRKDDDIVACILLVKCSLADENPAYYSAPEFLGIRRLRHLDTACMCYPCVQPPCAICSRGFKHFVSFLKVSWWSARVPSAEPSIVLGEAPGPCSTLIQVLTVS